MAVGRAMYSPYPTGQLPKLSRAQVHALAQLGSLAAGANFADALHCLSELLGLPLSCTAGAPFACSGVALASRTLAVWIELSVAQHWAAGVSPDNTVWLAVPFGACELLIERALGGEGPVGMIPTGTTPDALSLGALAYLAARMCAASGPQFRLRAVHATPPATATDFVCCAVLLQHGQDAATLHFYAATGLLQTARAARPALRALPHLPFMLWADAGYARLTHGELRSLVPGDVLVLERAGIRRARADDFEGTVAVRVEGSASALHCTLTAGRLEVDRIACTAETSMAIGHRIPDTARGAEEALARDAPVEISLEIARFQLRLDELERLRPGDVLVTGRRIGESVTLRAAHQPFAEGELVDVEGELGVRITRVLAE